MSCTAPSLTPVPKPGTSDSNSGVSVVRPTTHRTPVSLGRRSGAKPAADRGGDAVGPDDQVGVDVGAVREPGPGALVAGEPLAEADVDAVEQEVAQDVPVDGDRGHRLELAQLPELGVVEDAAAVEVARDGVEQRVQPVGQAGEQGFAADVG